MGRNGLAEIRRLSITPTAKRNSYRVAILVGQLPRVAGHARNPGLCNRNSYRAAAAAGWPLALCSGTGDRTPKPLSNSPQGERATAALDYVNATPLELSEVRTSQHRSPIPAFPKGKEPHQTPLNTASRDSRPLGRVGEGLQLRVIQGLLPLAMLLEDYLPMTNSRVPPAMMSA